jgi:hypothetical protein
MTPNPARTRSEGAYQEFLVSLPSVLTAATQLNHFTVARHDVTHLGYMVGPGQRYDQSAQKMCVRGSLVSGEHGLWSYWSDIGKSLERRNSPIAFPRVLAAISSASRIMKCHPRLQSECFIFDGALLSLLASVVEST